MPQYIQVHEQQPGSGPAQADGATADALRDQPHVHQVASLVPRRGGRCIAEKCECGRKFSRRDALIRHIRSKNKEARHSCPQCNQTFSRADHLRQHLRHSHRHGENRAAGAMPQVEGQEPDPMLAAAAAAEPQDHAPASTPQMSYVLSFLPPFFCVVPGCDRWGPNGFTRQEDLYWHMGACHTSSQGPVLYQPRPGFNAFPMNNALGHENDYNHQQGMNYHLILGDGRYINAVGGLGDEHQQFENYEPAEGPFQHGGYMNGFDRQEDDFQ